MAGALLFAIADPVPVAPELGGLDTTFIVDVNEVASGAYSAVSNMENSREDSMHMDYHAYAQASRSRMPTRAARSEAWRPPRFANGRLPFDSEAVLNPLCRVG